MAKAIDTPTPETRKPNQVTIKAPNILMARIFIKGDAPLVVHRFSTKAKNAMLMKMEAGPVAKGKKVREALDKQKTFNESRYISAAGWDGFNASSIRCAMISACRLVNFKMTLAKMSIFTVPDGWDAVETQIPLVRIYGKPTLLESVARVETGQAYVTIRAMYNPWAANLTIRYDGDQFCSEDIANLVSRVGQQVGICEGRPDSTNSAGMGWGTFGIVNEEAKA